jgi:hypothetical protein
MINKIVTFLLLALFLNSCQENKNQEINNFSFEKSISNIGDNELVNLYFERDTIKVKVFKTQEYISIHCKNGKRLYRKKKFRLYALKNSNDLELAQSIISFNKDLKLNDLIGVYSKLITIRNKDYLFQEEIGKRLIESNSKREGVIFKIEINDSITLGSTKGENIHPKFVSSIIELVKTARLNNKYFNEIDWIKFKDLSKKYFKNLNPNHYYLNPVTFQLEPIFSGTKVAVLPTQDPKIFNPEITLDFLNYFKYSKDSNSIFLKKKNTTVAKKIIIPKGLKVVLNAGETIDLISSSSILSYSAFNINGEIGKMVKVTSSDSTGEGIHILQNKDSTKINYLDFSNQSSLYDTLKYNHQSLPSAFTVYGGKVTIENSDFKDLKSEDAVNLFRCKFKIDNIKIENTFSDAFDADFCSGFMKNCSFKNCGNDGVDISGGRLEISESEFLNIKDKAISAGEESKLKASNCMIQNSSMGIISKDLSVVESIENKLLDCEIGYCAFQKKGEFGPAEILSTSDEITNCLLNDLIEYNSNLTFDGEKIRVFQNNVIDYLYGKKYGKATFKKN